MHPKSKLNRTDIDIRSENFMKIMKLGEVLLLKKTKSRIKAPKNNLVTKQTSLRDKCKYTEKK